jgi:metal-responsive CopG/Arc/MetJ family transcriptional regulator
MKVMEKKNSTEKALHMPVSIPGNVLDTLNQFIKDDESLSNSEYKGNRSSFIVKAIKEQLKRESKKLKKKKKVVN